MKTLYDRVNYKKQLVNKLRKYFDFDTLEEQFKKFINGFIVKGAQEGKSDGIVLDLNKAYSELNRLLHKHDGKIFIPKNITIAEDISNMADEMPEDSNMYLTYLNTLITMEDGPITIDKLRDRCARLCSLPEFADEQDPNKKKIKFYALYAASATLTEIVYEHNGIYRNPNNLRNIMNKTFYAKETTLGELADEDKVLYEEFNNAKQKSIKTFLPFLLLKSRNGLISIETVQDEYNRILDTNLFGPNTEVRSKIEFEKIYQALQLTLAENGDIVTYDDKDRILKKYSKNIPRVETQAKINAILSSKETYTEESLADLFEESLKEEEKDKSEIEKLEQLIDFEIAYCSIVKEIKQRNGNCNSQEAVDAYNRALGNIEKYREMCRKQIKSPFLIFPKKEKGKEDEIYADFLNSTKSEIENISSTLTIEKICELVGKVKAYRELYDIVKDPTKRRELEDVKFDVIANKITGLDPCELLYLRNITPVEIMKIENKVGDEISVREVGSLKIYALRQPGGKPTRTDTVSTKEYEVTKIYHSTREKDEEPKVRKFRVFSQNINGEEIMEDSVLRNIFANEIFSDVSLEAAQTENGGAIATAQYVKTNKGERAKIFFDDDMVAACMRMNDSMNEYDDLVGNKSENRYVAKRIKNGALVGNSNVRLSKGYASKIMEHVSGDNPERDVLFAFEWSDIEKKRTIFDTIARSRNVR